MRPEYETAALESRRKPKDHIVRTTLAVEEL